MVARGDERAIRLRLGALVVCLTGIGLASLTVLALRSRELSDFFEARGDLEVAFILLAVALLTVVLVPASLLAAASGYALGTVLGFPVALTGLVAGATAAAGIGRLVGTLRAASALGERVARVTRWLEMRPLRAVVVARLVPGVPFNATSYICGLTSIPLSTVALGTAVGFAPRGFAYTALGGSISDFDKPEAKVAVVVSVAILVTLFLVPHSISQSWGSPRSSLPKRKGTPNG